MRKVRFHSSGNGTGWFLCMLYITGPACYGQDMCRTWKHHYGHADKGKHTFAPHIETHLDIRISSFPVEDYVCVIPSLFPLFSPSLWADGTASTWVSSSQKGSQRVILWWRVWVSLDLTSIITRGWMLAWVCICTSARVHVKKHEGAEAYQG